LLERSGGSRCSNQAVNLAGIGGPLQTKGHRSREIAAEMGIVLGTVNTYVRNIYEKLHVRSRAEAVAKFLGK
jgi:hypothetical protein